jgi:hypothetical protein
MLNWMARANRIGGIYSRPVAMGNFLHFTMGALVLLGLAMPTLIDYWRGTGPTDWSIICGSLPNALAVSTLMFGFLMMRFPSSKRTGGAPRRAGHVVLAVVRRLVSHCGGMGGVAAVGQLRV